MSLSLLMSLTACNKVIYKDVAVLPPAQYMADCPSTAVTIKTNGDLAHAYVTRTGDLARCNADKQALREWRAGMSK